MNHPTEETWFAYRDGEKKDREALSAHLKQCPECRASLAKIEAVFAALDSIPVPDPGEDYGQRVWRQIAHRLPERKSPWWKAFLAPRRLVAVGAFAAVILAAFVAGRWTGTKTPVDQTAQTEKVRERVLVVAVGKHLGKSEMMLMELENAPEPAGQKTVNISATQRRAQDLVEENRLYRQTALKEGDQAMASTLDELERVLLDIANSPDQVTPAQFESMRKRIESRGILFKVRVVNKDLQEREKAARPAPAQQNSGIQERNKA